MQRIALLLLTFLLLLTACTQGAEGTAVSTTDGEPRQLRLVTHDSFSISEEVLAEFESRYNAEVVLVPAGDAGAMVNQSILSKNNPLGDVIFGVDNTFLTRALNEELFVPYRPAALEQVPDSFELDPDSRVVPIDYGDVCLNYDTAYFETNGLAVPQSLADLTQPQYRDLTVVENPASSSPGLAFVLATVDAFGDQGWQGYWADLRANGVLVADGWQDAYYGQFSGGGGEGTRPIVVSYATSPAASAGATASVVAEGTCFRQIEFAGILQNGQNPDLAQAWIDFMLSPTFQNDVAAQMYVYPVLEGATLPPEFEQYAPAATNPVILDPTFIEQNRDALIEEWTRIVIR